MPTKRNISNNTPLVFSIGGSIVNPGSIDLAFLRTVRALLLRHAKKRRLGLVIGGGHPARVLQAAAQKLNVHDHVALDWIGIRSTHLNAEFMRFILGAHASPVVTQYKKPLPPHRIIMGAGEEPGHSTDFDAILLAEKLGATTVYNLSNIDYVYDRDPAQYKNAVPLKDLTWADYVRHFPLVWKPGLHAPFDPSAVKRARKNHMTVIVMNGRKSANLGRALAGKPFIGTVIHP